MIWNWLAKVSYSCFELRKNLGTMHFMLVKTGGNHPNHFPRFPPHNFILLIFFIRSSGLLLCTSLKVINMIHRSLVPLLHCFCYRVFFLCLLYEEMESIKKCVIKFARHGPLAKWNFQIQFAERERKKGTVLSKFPLDLNFCRQIVEWMLYWPYNDDFLVSLSMIFVNCAWHYRKQWPKLLWIFFLYYLRRGEPNIRSRMRDGLNIANQLSCMSFTTRPNLMWTDRQVKEIWN